MQQNTVFGGEYSRRDIFLVMTLVYIFGVICRYYWVVWTLGMDEFWLNGVPLLTTNDAFANAEGARYASWHSSKKATLVHTVPPSRR